MHTDQPLHPVVKKAIDALQEGDKKAWLSFFAPDARLFDDGNPVDFHQFSEGALGHERFVHIDKVENDGTEIYGAFHSDRWGNFKTYFKFELDANGLISHLRIGQADY